MSFEEFFPPLFLLADKALKEEEKPLPKRILM